MSSAVKLPRVAFDIENCSMFGKNVPKFDGMNVKADPSAMMNSFTLLNFTLGSRKLQFTDSKTLLSTFLNAVELHAPLPNVE